jgi:predicted esterase YcpF (UPF0227 family)
VILLYLHGFRSSPRSQKALQLQRFLAGRASDMEFICPALPPSPASAMALLETLLPSFAGESVCLCGSSLGGYYATYLAESYGFKAMLLNPALLPQKDLSRYLGVQTVYGSSETIEVKAEFLGELEALFVPAITRPERYFLLAATGDELIDWRDMVAKYRGARMHVIEGSDHGISDFDRYLEMLLDFAKQP